MTFLCTWQVSTLSSFSPSFQFDVFPRMSRWHRRCLVLLHCLSLFVIWDAMSWALNSWAARSCTVSRVSIRRRCNVAISIVSKFSSWSGMDCWQRLCQMLPYLANLLATVLAAVRHDLLQCVAIPCLAAAGSVRLWPGQIARRYPGHPSLVLGDGGKGSVGLAAANVCALSLVGGGWPSFCVAWPVFTCWSSGSGGNVARSGAWLGWLAFGRLSARVRCPSLAMTAAVSCIASQYPQVAEALVATLAGPARRKLGLLAYLTSPCVAPSISLVSGAAAAASD